MRPERECLLPHASSRQVIVRVGCNVLIPAAIKTEAAGERM